MILYDSFCGAGGAAMGYHQAGFHHIVGVDIKKQPRYPFHFIQADALHPPIRMEKVDLIHASPPCQFYSTITHTNEDKEPDQWDSIPPTRNLLKQSEKPYIIENVQSAPLKNPIILCGEMFGLRVLRHRKFESNLLLFGIPHQKHRGRCFHLYYREADCYYYSVVGHGTFAGDNVKNWSKAMGIDWMTRKELVESIPPAYTKFLGTQAIRILRARS